MTTGTGGDPLNVRADAATDRKIIRTVANNTTVSLVCRIYGEYVSGPARNTALWDRLSTGGMVSGAYLKWPGERPVLPWCGEPPVNAVTSSVNAPGGELNVRSGPGTKYAILERIPNGRAVHMACRAWGETIDGNSVWGSLGPGRFVTAAYVKWSSTEPRYPWCNQAAPTVPAASQAAFFARVAAPARQSAVDTRVPASVTIAQAILESGWGKSWLTRLDHSYFGMKCFGGTGGIAIGCSSYATHECNRDGTCFPTRDYFRAYGSLGSSFLDHGKQLATLPRYATAMRYTADPDRFAREIHKAGYATSPTYADNLIKLMKQFNLYQYDKRP
ncbi:flagellar protein FlgJ [Allocatelliglobosispora scoriae]|uniref:Flagellar protein FlgJ n=1 Tax=Allocatelliglobosispora scoriae TaxID=643052 RepID=A0A841BLW4_9ACTN|nr:sporangiospore maturation cell wall hydrolase GsmA [Allocatelliglobosispora scoriae]MBB5869274.1 flagellar protein FlgJ [Allocatelliglobosispora scoriae]